MLASVTLTPGAVDAPKSPPHLSADLPCEPRYAIQVSVCELCSRLAFHEVHLHIPLPLRALRSVTRSANSRLNSSMNVTKAYVSGLAGLFSTSVGKCTLLAFHNRNCVSKTETNWKSSLISHTRLWSWTVFREVD